MLVCQFRHSPGAAFPSPRDHTHPTGIRQGGASGFPALLRGSPHAPGSESNSPLSHRIHPTAFTKEGARSRAAGPDRLERGPLIGCLTDAHFEGAGNCLRIRRAPLFRRTLASRQRKRAATRPRRNSCCPCGTSTRAGSLRPCAARSAPAPPEAACARRRTRLRSVAVPTLRSASISTMPPSRRVRRITRTSCGLFVTTSSPCVLAQSARSSRAGAGHGYARRPPPP